MALSYLINSLFLLYKVGNKELAHGTENIVFLTFAYIPIVQPMVSLQGCF